MHIKQLKPCFILPRLCPQTDMVSEYLQEHRIRTTEGLPEEVPPQQRFAFFVHTGELARHKWTDTKNGKAYCDGPAFLRFGQTLEDLRPFSVERLPDWTAGLNPVGYYVMRPFSESELYDPETAVRWRSAITNMNRSATKLIRRLAQSKSVGKHWQHMSQRPKSGAASPPI